LIGVVKAESKENIDSRAERPIYAVLTGKCGGFEVLAIRRLARKELQIQKPH
jgi:hypothetical protein